MFNAQVVLLYVDASFSLGRTVGPDKTGHFRTLWVWEALERVAGVVWAGGDDVRSMSGRGRRSFARKSFGCRWMRLLFRKL